MSPTENNESMTGTRRNRRRTFPTIFGTSKSSHLQNASLDDMHIGVKRSRKDIGDNENEERTIPIHLKLIL